MVSVLPLDKFVVINKSFLTDSDHLFLTLLYQPIVGNVAVGFYFTLWGFLDKCEMLSSSYSHYELINSMQVKLEDIMVAKEKLEAIGLLKTYFKKNEINEYIYELYAPLNINDFINNPILSTALFNNIGKKEFDKIIKKFELPILDMKSYTDISKSFKDVYSFEAKESNNVYTVRGPHYSDLAFEPTINFNDLLSLIPNELLNYKRLTKDIKNIIYQLAFIYNLDNNMMSGVIKNSLTIEKAIDVELLKDNCRKLYNFETKGKIPGIVYQNQPASLRKEVISNSRRDRLISQFENTSPREFLKLKNGGSNPTINDSKIIEYLMIDQALKPGVVNVLIDYVLKINNNKLVKPFVAQIATQWKRSNINTVMDAMELAQQEYDNRGNNKRSSRKKIEQAPNWLDQNITSERMTEEELKAFEEELEM